MCGIGSEVTTFWRQGYSKNPGCAVRTYQTIHLSSRAIDAICGAVRAVFVANDVVGDDKAVKRRATFFSLVVQDTYNIF